jgi:hypothetical protein
MIACLVCSKTAAEPYRDVQDVHFFKCAACGSLFADPDFIRRVEAGEITNYQSAYWDSEIRAAEDRSYGGSLLRVAETFRLCRIPIDRFIDIGTGTGSLLDALGTLVPELSDHFWGVEAFPPDDARRSRHPNYRVGTLADIDGRFEAGTCIEVIEHLSPEMLRSLAKSLAERAAPGALFFFNSAQPSFVETHDPDYLDPLGRGHIVSYSIAGLRQLFEPSGFSIIELPGRDWAFLAEYGSSGVEEHDPFHRLWYPVPENMDLLGRARLGPLMIGMGLESARCYLEHGRANALEHGQMNDVEHGRANDLPEPSFDVDPPSRLHTPVAPARHSLWSNALARFR